MALASRWPRDGAGLVMALAALEMASVTALNRFHATSKPFTAPAVVRYSVCARRAIDDGALDKARKTYSYYMARFGGDPRVPASESALIAHRWALLEQRAQNATGARVVFKLGARIVQSELRHCEAAGACQGPPITSI